MDEGVRIVFKHSKNCIKVGMKYFRIYGDYDALWREKVANEKIRRILLKVEQWAQRNGYSCHVNIPAGTIKVFTEGYGMERYLQREQFLKAFKKFLKEEELVSF